MSILNRRVNRQARVNARAADLTEQLRYAARAGQRLPYCHPCAPGAHVLVNGPLPGRPEQCACPPMMRGVPA
jgi:hypothetical protein